MYHFDEPGRGDDGGQGVHDHHFVVFKQFVIPGGQDKGDENKKKGKAKFNNPIHPQRYARCFRVHEAKYSILFFGGAGFAF